MSRERLLAAIWPHRWPLALCFFLMLVEAFAALLMPWIGGRIASDMLGGTSLGMNVLAPAFLAVLGVQAGLQILHGRILSTTSVNLTASLRHLVYDHLQRLPISFFHGRRHGAMIALLTSEIDNLSSFVTKTLLSLVPRILVFLGALVLMIQIDPILALPALFGVPGFFILVKMIGRQVRPLATETRDTYAAAVSVAEENLAVLPVIKSFTREDREAVRYGSSVDDFKQAARKLVRIQATLGPALQFASAAAVVGVLWLAAERVNADAMAPADLVTFLLATALLTRPVSGLADTWGAFQHARGALAHMDRVLSTSAEPRGGARPERIRGAISFEGVSFSYPGRARTLSSIDLDIAAGQTVALTGPNGVGKSTLVDLLIRFQEPDAGRITLDGIDIRELDLAILRGAIALVPQEVMLIDGTIEDNIRFGDPEARDTDILVAARDAQALDFIEALADGMATRIGDRGVRLSGGQRQRIALARALLKKPAVLVLDEPTAMFDPDGEARFVATARAALADQTVILITHRPASLELADRVVSLGEDDQPASQNTRLARAT